MLVQVDGRDLSPVAIFNNKRLCQHTVNELTIQSTRAGLGRHHLAFPNCLWNRRFYNGGCWKLQWVVSEARNMTENALAILIVIFPVKFQQTEISDRKLFIFQHSCTLRCTWITCGDAGREVKTPLTDPCTNSFNVTSLSRHKIDSAVKRTTYNRQLRRDITISKLVISCGYNSKMSLDFDKHLGKTMF